jgi:hypothetical protein
MARRRIRGVPQEEKTCETQLIAVSKDLKQRIHEIWVVAVEVFGRHNGFRMHPTESTVSFGDRRLNLYSSHPAQDIASAAACSLLADR